MNNELIENNNEFIIYTTDDGQVDIEVRLEDENVWLTQNSMAELFDTTKQNISLHIKNIFEENELNENSVVKENLTTAKDGKNYKTKFYNLDLIISVGYRVKSVRGTQFRIWANKLIKEYLIKGYNLNVKRFKNEWLKRNNSEENSNFNHINSDKKIAIMHNNKTEKRIRLGRTIPNLEIRPYKNGNQDEIQFIYNLKKEVYQKYVENIYGEWNEENQKKLFNKFMKENSKNIELIYLKDEKVGFYNGKDRDDNTFEICNICIKPEYQNKRIETAVLEEILFENKGKEIINKMEKQILKLNEGILEKCIPKYLERDLTNLKEGLKNGVNYIDCLIDELQGSINSAFVDGDISEEQCDYLYKKYIRMEMK